MSPRLAGCRLSLVALLCLVACSQRDPELGTTRGSANPPPLNHRIVSVAVPARVLPGGSLQVSVVLENTGTQSWATGSVQLVFNGTPATWSNSTLTNTAVANPRQTATFSGGLGASTQIGRHPLSWDVKYLGTSFGADVAASTEITCSDGVFCNGDERYVNGACVSGPLPHDDGAACSVDLCDEPTKIISRTLPSGCPSCAAKNCVPHCHGAACGDNGCGGSCGSCGSGQACADGACVAATIPGTCASPLSLVANQSPDTPLGPGFYSTTGDTSNGFNEVEPTCNPSAAKEKVYKLVFTQQMGIHASSSGFDTVLHLRAGSCAGATIACTDDSAPPGNFGSAIYPLLPAGTYYLVVDGFDQGAFGPYTLTVKAVAGCAPKCDGKFCGDDSCGDATGCGSCGSGEACNPSGRCVASPCLVGAGCQGRQCGTDACGNANGCGTCPSGSACDDLNGACKNFLACDNERPVCKTACSTNEYCGSDCACHDNRRPRPDLVVNQARMNDIVFDTISVSAASCALAEGCVGDIGQRKVIRFPVEAINQGGALLTVPLPKTRPDLFQYSGCHGHYHYGGFAKFSLRDPNGNLVPLPGGGKQAFCMESTVLSPNDPYAAQVNALKGPTAACEKLHDCDNQGIDPAWSDLYGNGLDCQWVDITGLKKGRYKLRVDLNPDRAFDEISFDNNWGEIDVNIP